MRWWSLGKCPDWIWLRTPAVNGVIITKVQEQDHANPVTDTPVRTWAHRDVPPPWVSIVSPPFLVTRCLPNPAAPFPPIAPSQTSPHPRPPPFTLSSPNLQKKKKTILKTISTVKFGVVLLVKPHPKYSSKVYDVNFLLYWRRLECSDWDHKLTKNLFT